MLEFATIEPLLANVAESLGCEPLDDGSGFLTTILPKVGPDGREQMEGHFRVDPGPDGSWTISWTPDRAITIAGDVSPNALAAIVGETLRDARYSYCVEFGHPVPLPTPPPHVRSSPLYRLAEGSVADALGGTLATAGNSGFDVLLRDGTRIQVKASVRNTSSGRISTITLGSLPSYADHDALVYVEFTADHYPVQAWRVASDLYRQTFPNDGKSHQIEPFLSQHAEDLTGAIRQSFDRLYLQ